MRVYEACDMVEMGLRDVGVEPYRPIAAVVAHFTQNARLLIFFGYQLLDYALN